MALVLLLGPLFLALGDAPEEIVQIEIERVRKALEHTLVGQRLVEDGISAVAFSRRFEEMYGDLQNSFSALTVEAIFNFCELPFAERITRRRVFAKSGRLVRNDLISMDLASRFNAPEDLLTAQVQVSNRTFDYLVGDNELMDEFMEFSSKSRFGRYWTCTTRTTKQRF